MTTPVWYDRFWSKVERSGDPDGCWVWTACKVSGYGQFQIESRRRARAHRIAYEELVGPIPAGLVIDHLCRNKGCVNPAHLEPVTNRENVLRGGGTAGIAARTGCCPMGHPLSGDNLGWTALRNGRRYRQCRECRRTRWKEPREVHLQRCRESDARIRAAKLAVLQRLGDRYCQPCRRYVDNAEWPTHYRGLDHRAVLAVLR